MEDDVVWVDLVDEVAATDRQHAGEVQFTRARRHGPDVATAQLQLSGVRKVHHVGDLCTTIAAPLVSSPTADETEETVID